MMEPSIQGTQGSKDSMYGLVASNVLRHAPLASFVEEILAIIFEVCELRRIALGLLGLCQNGLSQKATDVYQFRVVKFHVAYFVSCGQMRVSQ